MICRAINGLSLSQGLQTGSPPLSGLRPTPPLFPFGLRARPGSPKTGGVGRSMVRAEPHPAPGGNEPRAPSAPTTGGNGFHASPPSREGNERPLGNERALDRFRSKREAPTPSRKEASIGRPILAFSARQTIRRTPSIPIASEQPSNRRTRMRPERAKRAQDALFPLIGVLTTPKKENVSQTCFCPFPQRAGFHGICPIPINTPSPPLPLREDWGIGRFFHSRFHEIHQGIYTRITDIREGRSSLASRS
jgi:hypothetical protein